MRKIVSLTLVIAGLIELVTSVVLYIVPAGRVAYWSQYQLFGLSKTEWINIHITVGTLFIILAGIHIFLNWRPITAYLKNRAKQFSLFTKHCTIAVLLSLYVTIGTLYDFPPMNYIIALGEYFTTAANARYGEPPYGHAELSSLKMFCSRMDIDLARAIELLKENGMAITDAKQPLGEIARTHSRTPQQLFEIIKKAENLKIEEGGSFPDAPPPGFGRKTIREICQVYDLPLAEVLARLREAGFFVQADDPVKDVSSDKESNPMIVFEKIKEIAR